MRRLLTHSRVWMAFYKSNFGCDWLNLNSVPPLTMMIFMLHLSAILVDPSA